MPLINDINSEDKLNKCLIKQINIIVFIYSSAERYLTFKIIYIYNNKNLFYELK